MTTATIFSLLVFHAIVCSFADTSMVERSYGADVFGLVLFRSFLRLDLLLHVYDYDDSLA